MEEDFDKPLVEKGESSGEQETNTDHHRNINYSNNMMTTTRNISYDNTFTDNSGGNKKINFTKDIGKDHSKDFDENNMERDALKRIHIAAYAVGHFSNDLCAAAWFTYVLYFVKNVVKLDAVIAAFVMLTG